MKFHWRLLVIPVAGLFVLPGCYSRSKRAEDVSAAPVSAPAAGKPATSIADAAPAPSRAPGPDAGALTPGQVIILDGIPMTVDSDDNVSAAPAPTPAPTARGTSPAVRRVPGPGNTRPPHAMPARLTKSGKAKAAVYARTGFSVYEEDGRLWVFKAGSRHEAEFLRVGEPAKSTTLIGQGPHRMTMRGAERHVLESYKAAWTYGGDGLAVFLEDGRLWVLAEGSKGLEQFLSVGEPAKSVTLIGQGPNRMTLRSTDRETANAFKERIAKMRIKSTVHARPGFEVYEQDGRLWVFRSGSKYLKQYLDVGEPAKSTTRIGAGPGRMSIRAPDAETIDAYLAAER